MGCAVVDIDPAAARGAVGERDGGVGALEQAACRVGHMEAFVGVEGGERRAVGDAEDVAGDTRGVG